MNSIRPFLWFDSQAEDAAKHYVSIFKNSQILDYSYYSEAGQDKHQQRAGTVMTVDFDLNGLLFTALNGGPMFRFNESISFMMPCDSQEEIDYYWEKLSEDGQPGPCGWIKDKFGVSWQIAPTILSSMLKEGGPLEVTRVTEAFMKMKKFDIKLLEAAYRA